MTTDPQYLWSLSRVSEACWQSGAWTSFGNVINGPPDTTGPDLDAVLAACANVYDDLVIVLTGQGWTNIPAPGSARITAADFKYLGHWKLRSGRPGWEYATDLQLCVVPFLAQAAILLSNKAGTVGWLDLTLGDRPDGSTIDWVSGEPLLNLAQEGKALTGTAGTLGGMAFNPADGLVWACLYDFYNTAGADPPGIVAFDPFDLSNPKMKGAWRAGPPKASWACSDIPGLNCQRWVDPLTLEKYHANKCHEWITAVPPGTVQGSMAVGRQRPAGAFGGAQGPALYVIDPDFEVPPGSNLGAGPLIVYPTGSKTWDRGHRNAEGDDTGTGCRWIKTSGLREAIIFNWTKAIGGSNWYGQPGPPCNPEKGWHVKDQNNPSGFATWKPMLYLYHPDDLATDTPWTPQPYEEIDLSADVVFPDGCEGPGLTSIDFDAASWILYGVQPKADGDPLLVKVHAWEVAP